MVDQRKDKGKTSITTLFVWVHEIRTFKVLRYDIWKMKSELPQPAAVCYQHSQECVTNELSGFASLAKTHVICTFVNLDHWLNNLVIVLPSVFSRFVCVCGFLLLNHLHPFLHCLVCNLMPYLCCLHPARTSFFNVPCDLSASERGKQTPVSYQTLRTPTTESRDILDWRRRRHEFMPTIDSCHRDLPWV